MRVRTRSLARVPRFMAMTEPITISGNLELFRLIMMVGDDDIDMLGHASNLAYLRWVQDVALAHSEAVGFGLEGYQRIGGVFVVRRHEIDYLRPALRGDALEMRTWLPSVAAAKCHRATDITRAADGVTVARALTTWGFVEIATGRPTRIPDALRVAFGCPLRVPRSSDPPPSG